MKCEERQDYFRIADHRERSLPASGNAVASPGKTGACVSLRIELTDWGSTAQLKDHFSPLTEHLNRSQGTDRVRRSGTGRGKGRCKERDQQHQKNTS